MITEDNWFYWLLHGLVQWMIDKDLFHHRGKFNPGDIVVYNWKAKIYIASAIENDLEPRTVVDVIYDDKSGLEFIDGDTTDPFWMRKLHWWESWSYFRIMN